MRVFKTLLFVVFELLILIGFGIKFFEAYLVCVSLSDFIKLGLLVLIALILIFWFNFFVVVSKILK